MNKLYMGIDIGSVSVKGIIIDEYDNIITSSYLYIEENLIKTVKEMIKNMSNQINLDKYQVVSIGTTGSARKLIGTMLGATTIKNEITALAIGTIKLYPDVRTILEIGGHDSKIIFVNNGIVTDYVINNLCTSGAGSFIDLIAKRLNVDISDIANVAKNSKNIVNIDARCMVFAQNDLINKIQAGYEKEDIIAGVCKGIAINYINSIAKGKKIQTPIVFNGGVSKNKAIVESLEEVLGEKIEVNKNSHLMGALGVAIMARDSKKEKIFDFNIDNYNLKTKITNCSKCASNCEVVTVYKNNSLIDYWGNKCKNGSKIKNM